MMMNKKFYVAPTVELRWFAQSEAVAVTQSGFVDKPGKDDGEFDLGDL